MAESLPCCRQAVELQLAFGLQIDMRTLSKPPSPLQHATGRYQPAAAEGGIEENNIEGRFCSSCQKLTDVLLPDMNPGGGEQLAMVLERRYDSRIGLHLNYLGSAPGCRFETQRPAPRIEIQTPGPLDIVTQPVEQGFPDPIRRGPQALDIRKPELATAPFPGNQTYFVARRGP